METPLRKGRSSPVQRRFLIVALVLLGSISIAAGVSVWIHYGNNSPESEQSNNRNNTGTMSRQQIEGRDESTVSASSLDTHKVESEHPRILTIDKLSVKARVLPMGVNPDNSMQAPLNIFDSGWYTGSAKPDESGAVAIDGHASGPTREGLFAYLDALQVGDKINLERGDGTVITYEVTHTETVALDAVDMKKFLKTHNGVEKGLNLMTCAGEWLRGKNTFDHRVVVYTKQVI